MKNKLFLCAAIIAASAFSMKVNAQLEVISNGNVTVSKNLDVADTLTVGENVRVTDNLVSGKNLRATNNLTVQKNMTVGQNVAIGTNLDNNVALNVCKQGPYDTTPTYGIKTHVAMPPGYNVNYSLFGIYASVDGHNATIIHSPQPIIGVYGYARKNVDLAVLSAGVAGIAHWRSGVGVYGGINSPVSAIPADALYAGYFNGTTKVNGTLLTNMLVLHGDTINVNNARSIPTDAANSLTQLHPVSYSFKPDSTLKYDEKLQREMEGTHYGLIAQEVQKVLPELVYEREGSLSINYIEMIPLLIMKVQELSSELEAIKKSAKKD